MQTDPIPEPTAFGVIEREVLYLLTTEGEPIWSVEDIGRAIDSHVDAADAVVALQRAGLLNQTPDGHVFATRAGVCAVALIGAVV